MIMIIGSQHDDILYFESVITNKKEELITNMKERYCPRQQEGANRAKLPVFQSLRH